MNLFRYPTFYPVFLHTLFQVFLEDEIFLVSELYVSAPVFPAVELQVSALVSVVAEPRVFPSVFVVAELQVSALVSVVAEPHAFALVSVSEPQASVDIAAAFVVLVPVSVVAVEVDSPGHPRFFAFPNIDYCSSSSSYCEVAREESVHSSIGVRANDGLCSTLSNLDLHRNKNLEQTCNNPNHDHNKLNDTNDLPMDATTNHSRKKCLRLYQERRTHRTHQAPRSPPVVRQIQWVAADQY